MSKQKTASAGSAYPSTLQQLFQSGVYKGRQGRVTRQATWAALALAFALIAYKTYITLETMQQNPLLYYGIPGALLVGGVWLSFRLVNMPRFADFLIAVEAEMKKVSWPTWPELVRSSVVVIFVIFALGLVLLGYDMIWTLLLRAIGLSGRGAS